MAIIHGTRCAGLLVAMDLPFERAVEVLMGELALTHVEATTAMVDATRKVASSH